MDTAESVLISGFADAETVLNTRNVDLIVTLIGCYEEPREAARRCPPTETASAGHPAAISA